MKKAGYGLYLFLIILLAMELALRLYNPFHFRIRGQKILLPVSQRVVIDNRINPKLDPVVVNTRNSLGFRGPEPPADWKSHFTVITVGGSTTECHFLNDDRTWPFLLGKQLQDSFPRIWLNNAGLDGHSSFGHLVLLNDYLKQLRPRMLLFLVGINDVENDAPTFHDKLATRGAYPDFRHWLVDNSEVLNLAYNLFRGWRAQRYNNTTNGMLTLDSLQVRRLPDAAIARARDNQGPYLEGFRNRLEQLADTCLAWGIRPVFITQPNQFGTGRDPVTGADLSLFPLDHGQNGRLQWEVLEMYNEVTRNFCSQRGLTLVDLARILPKDSRYFYDNSHFTNAGAAEVARILAGQLTPLLRKGQSGL
jgi:lysophospholipase L1-like esterase